MIQTTSMNETDLLIMNQLCKVCGEPAAGYHFGAFTCEGCKSFFGRTYNNLSALGECKNNGECVINKKNRTSCKSCRLKKCLMVGMSKSGSRYGRRSNWFKIHCLIQDQQEMSSRMAEQSVLGTGSLKNNGSLSGSNGGSGGGGGGGGNGVLGSVIQDDLKITDPKDLLSKYKENEIRNNTLVNNLNEFNSLAAAAAAVNHHHHHHHHQNNNHQNSQNSHRISPRLAASPSTTNSDGSLGHRSISSPFHPGLFDSAKMTNPFTNPYLPAAAVAALAANQQNINHHGIAAAFNQNDFQKEFNNLASRFNTATIPLPPISPLSPINAVSRLFMQSNREIFGKQFNELQKLQTEQILLNQASKFLNPTVALNPVIKKQQPLIGGKDMTEENGFFVADLAEQDAPIDLSVKKLSDYKELSLAATTELSKCSKQIPGDHDSGFSPSSNEDNHNTSPLDLTSTNHTTTNNKRPCLSSSNRGSIHGSGGGGGGGKSASMMMLKNHHRPNHIQAERVSMMMVPTAKQANTAMHPDDDDDDDDDEVDVDVEDDVDVDDEADDDDDEDDDHGQDGDDETSDVEVNDEHRDDIKNEPDDKEEELINRRKRPRTERTSINQNNNSNNNSATTNNNSHRHEIPYSLIPNTYDWMI